MPIDQGIKYRELNLLREPLYPFHEHVIPRLALLLFVFMLYPEDDRSFADSLISRRREKT